MIRYLAICFRLEYTRRGGLVAAPSTPRERRLAMRIPVRVRTEKRAHGAYSHIRTRAYIGHAGIAAGKRKRENRPATRSVSYDEGYLTARI